MQFDTRKAQTEREEFGAKGGHAPNQGIPLDLDWIGGVVVEEPEVEESVAAVDVERTLGSQSKVNWLLQAISCIDLTTLSGDDTPDRVRELCEEAREPVSADVLRALGTPSCT